MKKKGFTLIELLVVIAIIGLLSTLAVIALNNAREKSRDAKRVADIKQVQTALEMYYNAKNTYPTCGTYGDATDVVGVYTMVDGTCADELEGEYFGGIDNLHDPKATNPAAGTYDVCQDYVQSNTFCDYGYHGSSNEYAIYFYLEGSTGAELGGEQIHTATESGIQ